MRRTGDGEPWRAPTREELSRIGELFRLTIPEDVVLAHLGSGEFGAILPDIDRPAADQLVAHWEEGLLAVLYPLGDATGAVPHVTSGLCRYEDRRFVGDRQARLTALSLSERGSSTDDETTVIEPDRPAPRRTRNGSRHVAEVEDASDHGAASHARSASGR